MPSLTTLTLKSYEVDTNGNIRSGGMQAADTVPVHDHEEINTRLDSLGLRRVFYDRKVPRGVEQGDLSILLRFGVTQDKEYIMVFYNTGATGPGLGLNDG